MCNLLSFLSFWHTSLVACARMHACTHTSSCLSSHSISCPCGAVPVIPHRAEIRKAWCEDTAIQVFFWSKAALSKLYTLIVVDPDAPNSPLFPPGPFASPIRHW